MKSIMVRVAGVLFLASVLVSIGWSQPTSTAIDSNSRFGKALGTDVDKIVQHYYLTKNGGVMEFTAKDPGDTSAISAVQKYMNAQRDLFEKGKIDADADIHSRVPDGVSTLKRLRNEITFFAVKTEDGAALRMFSVDTEARRAIHDFLKFQIGEHKTGDPLVSEE